MGTSCFNIISCGCINESVDRDQIDVSSQNKGRDKPGWSLRKKSTRHQVPSNTVVTEKIPSSESKEIPEPITVTEKIPSSANKEILEPITVTEKIPSLENKEILEPITISEPQIYSNISEKTSDNIWTEDTPISVTKNAVVLTTVTKPACEEDVIKCEPDESESELAILVIQAAVRRFLAERQLVKHKNVVKLQAAVRGHLVRSHAVGTLRCVQAIVKMQALVRARREKGVHNAGINSTPTYISVEKLLSNRLARQLLESTPKTKQINIKCDPLKSDSAWNWLERWMSVSSPETLESQTQDHDQEKVVNNTENEVKMVIPSNNVGEATVRFGEKENLTNIEEDYNVKTHEEEAIPQLTAIPDSPLDEPVLETKPEPVPEDLVSETKTKPVPEVPVSETKPEPISEGPVSETKPEPTSEDSVSETKSKLIPENPVSETKPKDTEKQIATNQPDSEGRKRKASNPAFIAAQSRFKELTSFKTNPKSPNSSSQDDEAGSGSGSGSDSSSPADNSSSDPVKSAKSSNQDDLAVSGSLADIDSSDRLRADNEVVSRGDIDPSAPEKTIPVTDAEQGDYVVTNGSQVVQNGGSECETELSITSTLDSPDQFEIENNKFEEVEMLNEAVPDTNMTVDDNINNNNIDIVMPAEKQVDQKLDDSGIEVEPKSDDHEPVVQLSVSESPRSHITTLESQGTPSSQISTTTKKTKSDKKVSGQKLKSWSTSKKSSPVRSSADSGLRSSLEKLPKDLKPVKRRNSIGSPKPDHLDHEQLVPSYMQATESARAKAVANSSPRSSPDVHDKETYLKKRHSLPIAVNDRQGSPRILRSMSQALQTTKGNGNQERKWQR